jgi:hypothetical protein
LDKEEYFIMSDLLGSVQPTSNPIFGSTSIMRVPKRRQESNLELVLQFLNMVICIIYATSYHGSYAPESFGMLAPFLTAYGTVFRILLFITGGRWIGNLIPFVGDICVIGSLGLAMFTMFKTYVTGSA